MTFSLRHLVTGLLCYSLLLLCNAQAEPSDKRPQDLTALQNLLKTYTEVLSISEENYADPLDFEKSIGDSIQNMLRLLDPHSTFYDAKAFKEFQEYQGGNYFGIGARIALVDDEVMVIQTMPGSPALSVGLKPGDVIEQVSGEKMKGKSTEEVASRLRGPKGTAVLVTIRRLGVEESQQFSITRDEIPQFSVPLSYKIRPNIGYLQLVGFTATTEKEVSEALNRLGPDLDGLVLDLRNNLGGYLQAAIAVADRFLERNHSILITKGRLPNANYRYTASQGQQGRAFPLVVLINGRSASAAEIVAGAIQDHDRGLVVGENSFGKGLVQTIFPLSGGTAVSLTTAKWYTPSGRLIQREYKHRSLADYYSARNSRNSDNNDVWFTDHGREVYGGGGISPDIQVKSDTYNELQAQLLSRYLTFGFARQVKDKYPAFAEAAVVNDLIITEFRQFLSARDFRVSEQEFQDNLPFIRRNLRSQLLALAMRWDESNQVELEDDSQVLRALAAIPEAKALLENSKKSLARNSFRESKVAR